MAVNMYNTQMHSTQYECMAVSDSGNYTLNLNRILSEMGYDFEVVATPAKISGGNCGYSLKFPEAYKDIVIETGIRNSIPVRKIYRVVENDDIEWHSSNMYGEYGKYSEYSGYNEYGDSGRHDGSRIQYERIY